MNSDEFDEISSKLDCPTRGWTAQNDELSPHIHPDARMESGRSGRTDTSSAKQTLEPLEKDFS